jgi:hypothetical protein
MDEDCCLFCSDPNHQVKNCLCSSSNAVKGHATTMIVPAIAVAAPTTMT